MDKKSRQIRSNSKPSFHTITFDQNPESRQAKRFPTAKHNKSLSTFDLGDIRKEKLQVDTTYSFQNSLIDRLIQHLTVTKKMQIVTKATGKTILLNDYDGMREVMEKFAHEIIKLEKEVGKLKQDIANVNKETEQIRKKSFDLRFMKSIEESRVKSKGKFK